MHRRFATVCSRIMQFSQKYSEFTGKTKNGQIFNIMIKYSLIGSW